MIKKLTRRKPYGPYYKDVEYFVKNRPTFENLFNLPSRLTIEVLGNFLTLIPMFDKYPYEIMECSVAFEGIPKIGYYDEFLDQNDDFKEAVKRFDKDKGEFVDYEWKGAPSRRPLLIPGSLPAAMIVKVGLLSKKYKNLIETWFAPFKLKDFKMHHDTIKMINLLLKEPNFENYAQNKLTKQMKQAFKNPVYGQTIF